MNHERTVRTRDLTWLFCFPKQWSFIDCWYESCNALLIQSFSLAEIDIDQYVNVPVSDSGLRTVRNGKKYQNNLIYPDTYPNAWFAFDVRIAILVKYGRSFSKPTFKSSVFCRDSTEALLVQYRVPGTETEY